MAEFSNKNAQIHTTGLGDEGYFQDMSTSYIDIEKICETLEQDARRYKRYLGADSQVRLL